MEAPSRLVQVYAVNLLELGLKAEALALGETSPGPAGIDCGALLTELLDTHAPLAASAGLKLSRSVGVAQGLSCIADAVLLRITLSYLLLRAMVGEPAPGHVRVVAAVAQDRLRITLVSRAMPPSPALQASSDLAAVRRLLFACDAELSIDPAQGGYLPVTLSLRAAHAAASARAA